MNISSHQGHQPITGSNFSPRQWKLLSDRIERNIEDVLCEVVPPRAATAPPRPTGSLWDELFDAGNDVRLDIAYSEYYRDQSIGNAHLPSPLDAQTLFSNLARQLIDDQNRSKARADMNGGQGVHQLVQLVQDFHGSRQAKQPVNHDTNSISASIAAHNLADGISQMQFNHADSHPSLQRPDAAPPSKVSQYMSTPASYRAQLSPSPQPQSDSCSVREPVTNDTLFTTAENPHIDTGAGFEPTIPIAQSPSIPSLSASPQPYTMRQLPDPHVPTDVPGGPPLQVHPALPHTIPSISYPSQHSHSTAGPGLVQPIPSSLAPVNPSFQNTFNAAFYAACLANNPGTPVAPPPGPPLVMDAGHIIPMRGDIPYSLSAGAEPTIPLTEHMVRSAEHAGSPYMIPSPVHGPSSAPNPATHLLSPNYIDCSSISPGKLAGIRTGQYVDGASAHFLGELNGRGRGRGKVQRRESARRGPRGPIEVGTMEVSISELSGRALAQFLSLGNAVRVPAPPMPQMLQMSKEQHGCRYLQRLLAAANQAEVQLLLDEILPHTGELMVDPFGNYLIQKVLDVCSPAQRLSVLEHACKAGLPEIVCNAHGTRAAQKLVEAIETPEEATMFIEQLKPQCLRLIFDGNSNHVIQRCLQKFDACRTEAILKEVAEHSFDVARHRHGCCVLQRCMDYASPECKLNLVMRVSEHGLELSQNAFGNYVVQYILETGVVDACERILAQLRGSFAILSCQKFASNVVEKALKLSTVGMEHWRSIIVNELVDASDHAELLKDQYGNYVLQSALRVTNGDLHARLVQAIKPHMSCLKSLQHGKRIMQQLQGAV